MIIGSSAGFFLVFLFGYLLTILFVYFIFKIKIKYIIISLVATIGFLYFYILDLGDLDFFRVINDDGINFYSLISRLSTFENFLEHLYGNSYILGGMDIDKVTTGSGSYSHSFVLSLLSHGGLFPSLIIGLIIIKYVKLFLDLSKSKDYDLINVNFQLCSLLFIFSSFARFFTWQPLYLAFLISVSTAHNFVRLKNRSS